MFCPSCGTEGSGNFCMKCGYALKREGNAPSVPPENWAQNIIGKRLCNAFIKDAEVKAPFYAITSVNAVISDFKERMGGLWVGGATYLTKDAIIFRPNLVNRLIHKQDYSVRIPLSEIVAVQKRFGFVTQIIDIKTGKGIFSIRCFRPNSFIDMINNARRTS